MGFNSAFKGLKIVEIASLQSLGLGLVSIILVSSANTIGLDSSFTIFSKSFI